MIYARKVLAKEGCSIYLAADIKCLDYHTPCVLVLKTAESEHTLARGDVLLFRNTLKPYIQGTGDIVRSRAMIFSSEDCRTYIYRDDKCVHMQITEGKSDDVICTIDVTGDELAALYKAIDLRWYNRTLPVYR